MKPIISIITINLNNQEGLIRTLESVESQKGDFHLEMIVIDGCSSDNSKDVINDYKDMIDHCLIEKDKGISDAFNKGVKLATGSYLFFLNSGDCFSDYNVLNMVSKDIIAKKKPAILFYSVQVNNGVFIPSKKYNNNKDKIIKNGDIPHQGAFISRDCFYTVGFFDHYLKIRMDLDFFLRCVKEKFKIEYIPDIIVKYEEGGVSMSNKKLFDEEGLSIKLKYGVPILFKEYVKFNLRGLC